jgi:hypothetical protein
MEIAKISSLGWGLGGLKEMCLKLRLKPLTTFYRSRVFWIKYSSLNTFNFIIMWYIYFFYYVFFV